MAENPPLAVRHFFQRLGIDDECPGPRRADFIAGLVAVPGAVVQDVIVELRCHFGHAVFVDAGVTGHFEILPARLQIAVARQRAPAALVAARVHDAASERQGKGPTPRSAPIEKGGQSRRNRQHAYGSAVRLGLRHGFGERVDMDAVRVDEIPAVRRAEITHDPIGHLSKRRVRPSCGRRNQAQNAQRGRVRQQTRRKMRQGRSVVQLQVGHQMPAARLRPARRTAGQKDLFRGSACQIEFFEGERRHGRNVLPRGDGRGCAGARFAKAPVGRVVLELIGEHVQGEAGKRVGVGRGDEIQDARGRRWVGRRHGKRSIGSARKRVNARGRGLGAVGRIG